MRVKSRYLITKIEFDGELNGSELFHLLQEALHKNFGDLGLGKCLQTLAVIGIYAKEGIVIVRVCKEWFRQLWFCMTMTRNFRRKNVRFSVIHVAGVYVKLKKVQKWEGLRGKS